MNRLRFLLLCVAALWPRGTAAAPDSEPSVAAVIERATTLAEQGDHRSALALFRSALPRATGDARPKVLYGLARCHQELGQAAEAIEAYRGFLGYEHIPDEARGKAQMAVLELEKRLSYGRVIPHVSPEGAEVLVDGQLVGKAPVAPQRVRPGRHPVAARLPDGRHIEKTVDVAAGGDTTVALNLAPASEGKRRFSPWAWATLGTGAAILVAGAVTFGLGEADHREIADTEGYGTDGVTRMTQQRASDLEASGDRKKVAGYALFGVGSAALVASAVWLIVDAVRPPQAGPAAPGTAALVPLSGGGLLSWRGSF